MISHDELTRLLHYDPQTGVWTNLVSRGRKPAGSRAGYVSRERGKPPRRIVRIHKQNYKSHRLAWFYMRREWPPFIDHKDCDSLNDAWSNLRVASISQNGANCEKRKRNKSGFKGVSWHAQREKWTAQINCKKQHYYLGLFATKELAHAAYIAKARALHGEFARA